MPGATKADHSKRFECPLCQKRFAWEYAKTKHVRVVHKVCVQPIDSTKMNILEYHPMNTFEELFGPNTSFLFRMRANISAVIVVKLV